MTNLNIQRIKEKAKRDRYDKIKDEVDNIILYLLTLERCNKDEGASYVIAFNNSLRRL